MRHMTSNKGGRTNLDFLVFELYNQNWVDMKNDVKPTQATQTFSQITPKHKHSPQRNQTIILQIC